jgi:hypothetical protein
VVFDWVQFPIHIVLQEPRRYQLNILDYDSSTLSTRYSPVSVLINAQTNVGSPDHNNHPLSRILPEHWSRIGLQSLSNLTDGWILGIVELSVIPNSRLKGILLIHFCAWVEGELHILRYLPQCWGLQSVHSSTDVLVLFDVLVDNFIPLGPLHGSPLTVLTLALPVDVQVLRAVAYILTGPILQNHQHHVVQLHWEAYFLLLVFYGFSSGISIMPQQGILILRHMQGMMPGRHPVLLRIVVELWLLLQLNEGYFPEPYQVIEGKHLLTVLKLLLVLHSKLWEPRCADDVLFTLVNVDVSFHQDKPLAGECEV